jgi:hypothetical protein
MRVHQTKGEKGLARRAKVADLDHQAVPTKVLRPVA